MKSLISIIVPIYNVENYLERCVNSLLNQTYQNIEIILVDDGSPDRCPQLCDEWKQKDERIRVLHKENGGLSSARNAGIRIAKGEYLAFIDSDDYVANNMIEKLYQTIVADGTDLCICDFCSVDEQGNNIETEKEQYAFQNGIFPRADILKEVCSGLEVANNWRLVPAWNKLYHKRIFENCCFEEGRLHEDEFAIHQTIYACDKISTIADKLYFYVQRENSIMSSAFSIKRFDAAFAYYHRYAFLKEHNEVELSKAALRQLYDYLVYNLYRYDVISNFKVINKMVMRTTVELIKNGNYRFVKLILAYLSAIIHSKKR